METFWLMWMAEAGGATDRLLQIARWFQSARGWQGCGVAVLLGAVSALAFAPLHVWPLIFLTFPAFVWLLDGAQASGRDVRQGLVAGWCFGFGYFLVGMHWIVFPFMVDADEHAWQIPFVALLFPGCLALFWGLATALASGFWHRGFARVLVLAVSVSASEWLRGHVLTGLPWNLPGYVWTGSDTMIQSASFLGIYGLSLATVLSVLMPAAVIGVDGKRADDSRVALGGIAILLAIWGYGLLRVPAEASPVFPSVNLRIVQPNVPQHEKWRPEFLMRNWKQLVDLTRQPGLESMSAVIWPEAAPPFPMLSTNGALEAVGTLLPDRTVLLTGTRRVEWGEPNRYFNSLVAIDGKGGVVAIYDKSHLVPFGEYLPLFRLLEPLGIKQLTGMNGGFSEGSGVRLLSAPGLPSFGVLICYEAIFPSAVVARDARPDWLVNITDDSWFGSWAGPYQHLGIARVRAVEEGLSVVRAANTGISAIIDPYGRINSALELNKAGVLDAALPIPLKPTVYSCFGDTIFVVFAMVLLVVAAIFSRSTP